MLALSIRDSTELAEVQPYAEEILRGIKRIEYRNRPTKIIGQTSFVYGAK